MKKFFTFLSITLLSSSVWGQQFTTPPKVKKAVKTLALKAGEAVTVDCSAEESSSDSEFAGCEFNPTRTEIDCHGKVYKLSGAPSDLRRSHNEKSLFMTQPPKKSHTSTIGVQ